MELVTLNETHSIDSIFREMVISFQKEYCKDFNALFRDKANLVKMGKLDALGLVDDDKVIGYLEYEVVDEAKVSFYIFYMSRGHQRVEIITQFINASVNYLKSQGFKRFVSHISPFKSLPIFKALEKAGFTRFVRNEMSLQLQRVKPYSLTQRTKPFYPECISELKQLMLKCFNGSVDHTLYSEFFTHEGQVNVVNKILTGYYGPFLYSSSLLLQEKDKLIGYGLLTSKNHETSFLMDFAIDPDYQGQGLGTSLLLKMMESLRNDGYKYLNLAVTVGNKKAYRLYKKMGFKITGEFEVYMLNI